MCILASRATHLIADVAGAAPRTTRYKAFNPARLLDTRPASSTFDGLAAGAGQRAAGSSLTLQVSGRGNPIALVPSGIRTVVLNVAAASPVASGFLTVWPCDQRMPNASNVNFAAGVTTANLVVAQLSAVGTVCVFNSRATHLIADAVGSFDQLAALNPSAMRTFNPARLVDTRASGITTDGRSGNVGPLAANTTYSFQIANRLPLAAANTAVLNVTVVGPAGSGFLTVWPCDQAMPNASSLNYIAGVNRANQLLARLSASGMVCVRSSELTHLVVGVSGSSM